MTVTLGELEQAGIGTLVDGTDPALRLVQVTGVQHDSRAVSPGDVYAAIRGANVDGHRFVGDALNAGAVAAIVDSHVPAEIPVLRVKDVRTALGPVSHRVYGDPTRRLSVVGITGTNGKTTTAWMIEAILTRSGMETAVLGTIGARVRGESRPGLHTTPEADDVARFASELVQAGVSHLVMEVSSHGLDMRRVDGVQFKVGAFTNLSQDHLDYHGDMNRYAAAKQRLFTELSPEHCVINVDDPVGREFVAALDAAITTSVDGRKATYSVKEWSMDRAGLRATVRAPEGDLALHAPLIGKHNLENLLVAVASVRALGVPMDDVLAAAKTLVGAPGRLERIPDARDVMVFVDYAHTPDALVNVLEAVRPVTTGRLLVVFGCGGDRDKSKRPLMGAAALKNADLCIVTSDNPRTEAAGTIIEDIMPGMSDGTALKPNQLFVAEHGYAVIEDREQAIRCAVGAALPGDTVVIAGKGHEDYQIIGTQKRHFDDREKAREAIEAAGGADGPGAEA